MYYQNFEPLKTCNADLSCDLHFLLNNISILQKFQKLFDREFLWEAFFKAARGKGRQFFTVYKTLTQEALGSGSPRPL